MKKMEKSSKVEKYRGKFKKGKPKTGGRKKGTLNRITIDVKQVAFDIFEGLGGVKGAKEFFQKNNQTKAQFFNLFFKMLPSNVVFDQEKPAKFIIEFNGNNTKPKSKNRKADSSG